MNYQLIISHKPINSELFTYILFYNFIIMSAGSIYYKRYYKLRKKYNPFFLLTLCYTGLYLNCMYMLPVNWYMYPEYNIPTVYLV